MGIFSGFGNHNDTDRIYGYFPELSGGDGKSGVMGILAALFIWKFVPETKGKTLEEMANPASKLGH